MVMKNNSREDRICTFRDTISHCKTNGRLRQAIRESKAAQQLILEGDDIPMLPEEPADREDVLCVVSKKRTLEAAQSYAGQRVCVLNFASATNPGGGVTKGSSAQEECLCRCSTLYPCISAENVKQGFHYRHRSMLRNGEMDALYNSDCIYTPGVIVLKSDTILPQILPEEQWYGVDVITCAAPNLRSVPGDPLNPGSDSGAVQITEAELVSLHEKRANRILDIAKVHQAEIVILGAFGCGAFRNPPAAVAAGIRKAVDRHQRDFRTIEFAVYCPPDDNRNYEAFREAFR